MAKTAEPAPEAALLSVPSAARWEAWLRKHHDDTPQGVWLQIFKQSPGRKALTYAEAVEVALCFGWIDGQARSHDAESKVQRFTPRRARSGWSKINTQRVERLVAEGRMQPAGRAQVEAAQRDGRWDSAYDPPSTATVPDDFLAELRKPKNRKAAAFFATLNKTNTYAISYRLQTAKKPETRARRMQAMIEQLQRGEKFHG